ncbi:RNA-binding domain-containing protein [Massarina eburnea CBS 473.64]|uniref:RNA-binding domain-containing protein n=1 Tax=Massarina eburnea CBS 473.64 TaxID=1395130 RepID=A0A6A6RYW4_9PLEO|nr:RNA-binding domain-containing protein [Massarina eburnea CBS 473.64]
MNYKDNYPPHPSLPARPPPSSFSAPSSRNAGARAYVGGGGANTSAFGGFTPRSVAAHAPHQVAAPPSMYSQPTVSAPYQPTAYPSSNAYYNPYQAYGTATPAAAYAAPAALNGGLSGGLPSGLPSNYDPEEEARIAEWNSAYTRDEPARKPGTAPVASRPDVAAHHDRPAGAAGEEKQKTVVREAGGRSWEDPSLLEWNPQHPRLFVGNLAGEVTDDSLLKAFSKYSSVVKARVVRDKRSTKSKSYGFVSFSDTDDYFRAAKEMNGKYIGSHPVLVKRATSEVQPVARRDDRRHGRNNRNNSNKNKDKKAGGPPPMPGVVPFSAANGVHKKGKHSGPRILG